VQTFAGKHRIRDRRAVGLPALHPQKKNDRAPYRGLRTAYYAGSATDMQTIRGKAPGARFAVVSEPPGASAVLWRTDLRKPLNREPPTMSNDQRMVDNSRQRLRRMRKAEAVKASKAALGPRSRGSLVTPAGLAVLKARGNERCAGSRCHVCSRHMGQQTSP